jgi:hypothetical protein
MRGGHVYGGGGDPGFVAWLKAYLTQKAEGLTGEEKRGALAFAALQGREGSTAAINTYDDQVFTWGSGWSGLGGLPRVMTLLAASSPGAVAMLANCGVFIGPKGRLEVVDDKGQRVTGQRDALQVIRATPALLNLFVRLAKDPRTREAAADAQLGAFLATSGRFAGSEAIATQALYTFVAHLKHWAPGWAQNATSTAAATVPGSPSVERDRALAPAIVRAFYGAAPSGAYIVKAWVPQLQRYVRDMREDGLDVTADPVLAASAPPEREAVA